MASPCHKNEDLMMPASALGQVGLLYVNSMTHEVRLTKEVIPS